MISTKAIAFHSIRLSGGADGTIITVVDPPQVEIRITARVARRLLRETVAEAGRGYVSKDGCAYILGGCPHCIVGRALYKAGLTEDELDTLDHTSPSVISEVRLPARVWMSGAARRVLDEAQTCQDVGYRWGVALNAALAVRPYDRAQLAGAA